MEGGTLDMIFAARDNVIAYASNLLDTLQRGPDAEHTLIRDAMRAAEAATWLATVCRFMAESKRDLEVALAAAKARNL